MTNISSLPQVITKNSQTRAFYRFYGLVYTITLDSSVCGNRERKLSWSKERTAKALASNYKSKRLEMQ